MYRKIRSNKNVILGMSKSKSRMTDGLVAASEQINLHIAKLMLFPDSEYCDHWMHEIWSFLFKVSKLKQSNKLPSQSFIKKALSEDNDILSSYLLGAEDDEENLDPVEVSVTDYKAVLESYQDWLSKELSVNGVVRQFDVKVKLTELLRRT